jgi:arsenite methyltransferase
MSEHEIAESRDFGGRFEFVPCDSRSFFWAAGFPIGGDLLFLLYVKFGKFLHRDFILGMLTWRGNERALDVGCVRGLILAAAAKWITQFEGSGHATGIDICSNTEMAGDSAVATE